MRRYRHGQRCRSRFRHAAVACRAGDRDQRLAPWDQHARSALRLRGGRHRRGEHGDALQCTANTGVPGLRPFVQRYPRRWINNGGTVAGNAASLSQYLSMTVGDGPALLVGHSMGGLSAGTRSPATAPRRRGCLRSARRLTAASAPTSTQGAAHFPCSNAVGACLALHLAARAVAAYLGSAAVADLTFVARAADDLTLGAPGVPTWTFAGTACDPTASPGYVFPNDGIVGEQSAFGLPTGIIPGANLGPTTQLTPQSDYHSSFLGGFARRLGPSAAAITGQSSTIRMSWSRWSTPRGFSTPAFGGNETRRAN